MFIYEQQAKKLIEEKASLEARLNSDGKTMAELQLKYFLQNLLTVFCFIFKKNVV